MSKLTSEQAKEWNCVVVAISALTGDDPNKIISEIAAAANPGEVSFDYDGYVNRTVYTRYLDAKGWKCTWHNAAPIPPTCLVITDGHTWAIKDGLLYDRGGTNIRWGKPILAIYEPPV